MAGLDPAIHVLLSKKSKDVDARDKRGHDDGEVIVSCLLTTSSSLVPGPAVTNAPFAQLSSA